MPEYWDLYDIRRRPLGEVMLRGDPTPPGAYHLVAETVVTCGGRLLVTRRHPDKPFGGMWEFTGGSCLVGEDTLAGAVREVGEEIGLTVAPGELRYLGTIRRRTDFVDSYRLERPGLTIGMLALQPEEVVEARIVTPWQVDWLCADRIFAPTDAARWHRYRRALFPEL